MSGVEGRSGGGVSGSPLARRPEGRARGAERIATPKGAGTWGVVMSAELRRSVWLSEFLDDVSF